MKLRDLYEARDLPVFQNRMYDTPQEARACARGDVILAENLETGLIYNRAFDPSRIDYDRNYQNEQAGSGYFRDHLNDVTGIVDTHLGRRALVEIGCGKGHFLEHITANGFDIRGIDPTYEGDNAAISKEYFTAEHKLRGDGIVLRHVLEHIPDPFSFLDLIRQSNGNRGRIYIEVPCFDWICEHRAWFDVFYEHVNYFRLSDFHRMFGSIHVADRFFGGQYIHVVADLSSLRPPEYRETERAHFPSDFLDRIPRAHGAEGTKTVVWGGASKGVIFALMSERAGVPVDAIIDINPAKQHKYIPATGLAIHAPDELLPRLAPGSTIYVMNSNYLAEIADMSGNAFHYVGIDRV